MTSFCVWWISEITIFSRQLSEFWTHYGSRFLVNTRTENRILSQGLEVETAWNSLRLSEPICNSLNQRETAWQSLKVGWNCIKLPKTLIKRDSFPEDCNTRFALHLSSVVSSSSSKRYRKCRNSGRLRKWLGGAAEFYKQRDYLPVIKGIKVALNIG